MGLSLDDFERLTPLEFNGAYAAHQRAKKDAWRQTQLLMWATLTPHTRKGRKLKPEDVLKLDGDEKPRTKPIPQTPEQQAARAARHARWDAEMASTTT